MHCRYIVRYQTDVNLQLMLHVSQAKLIWHTLITIAIKGLTSFAGPPSNGFTERASSHYRECLNRHIVLSIFLQTIDCEHPVVCGRCPQSCTK